MCKVKNKIVFQDKSAQQSPISKADPLIEKETCRSHKANESRLAARTVAVIVSGSGGWVKMLSEPPK